ncbi:MAG: hypothetical protein ACRYFS_03930 [Janthinobacterium lividum]
MTRPFCFFLMLLAVLTFTHPAACQSTDFVAALSGEKHPLTLKLKDLDSSWRSFTLTRSAGIDITAMLAPELNTAAISSSYFTQGETVAIGSAMFLVSYHYPLNSSDPQTAVQGSKPLPQTPNTLITLSLININYVSSFDNIRPFVLAGVVTPIVLADPNQVSMSNLHQIGVAVVQYTQDHNEVLPPMKSVAEADDALHPYINDVKIFENPITHQRYQTNTSLVHRNLASVEEAGAMVIYYETSSDADGKRAVLFLDGHVERVTEADWQRLKTASHVPNPPQGVQ